MITLVRNPYFSVKAIIQLLIVVNASMMQQCAVHTSRICLENRSLHSLYKANSLNSIILELKNLNFACKQICQQIY